MLWNSLLVLIGLVLLPVGASMLVDGASALAKRLGVSDFIIGLTVVAFGTSAPEFAVSISAALSGRADVAIGNIIGSNIFNVLVVLGLCLLITSLEIGKKIATIDIPLMLAASVLFLLFSFDGQISTAEGVALFFALVVYVWLLATHAAARNTTAEYEVELELVQPVGQGVMRPAGAARDVILGLGLLVVGGQALVKGAVALALSFGISELVVGLTVVAVGTSLPEVAASIAGVLKGKNDIAIGNIVGSNTFNIFGVLGLTAAVSPKPLCVSSYALWFDLPLMLLSVLLVTILGRNGSISRKFGLFFLVAYAVYTRILVGNAAAQVTPSLHPFVLIFAAVVAFSGWRLSGSSADCVSR